MKENIIKYKNQEIKIEINEEENEILDLKNLIKKNGLSFLAEILKTYPNININNCIVVMIESMTDPYFYESSSIFRSISDFNIEEQESTTKDLLMNYNLQEKGKEDNEKLNSNNNSESDEKKENINTDVGSD